MKDKAKQLIALREKATQGEWVKSHDFPVDIKNEFCYPDNPSINSGDSYVCQTAYDGITYPKDRRVNENAEFIAYAANHAAEIAEAYLELKERLDGPKGLKKQLSICLSQNHEMAAKLENSELTYND